MDRAGARYSIALAVEPTAAFEQDSATQELLSGPAADRCANCNAPLASDQRYCVGCGERRGKARFSFEALTAPPAPAPAPARRRWIPHVSSSFSFITGVATLLLALGVGVLIGHSNNPKATQAAAPSQVIKIEGNLGNNGASNTAASGRSAFAAPNVKLTPKVIKKVNQAASKVLGSGASNLAGSPTQQVGQSCSSGAGCQGHKFTGNFFGGG